jgi:hypothetical protein
MALKQAGGSLLARLAAAEAVLAGSGAAGRHPAAKAGSALLGVGCVCGL